MTPILKPRGSVFNARTITAPIAAAIMACLLYTYSVTSIRAAKRNAQLHREADGGQLDMRRESLRKHGALERVANTDAVALFRDIGAGGGQQGNLAGHESLKMGAGRARKLGEDSSSPGERRTREKSKQSRTAEEGSLEGYKGVGKAVERFREEKPLPVEE